MKIFGNLWKVTITEYDSFSGPTVMSEEVYTTRAEADAAAFEVNKKNTSKTAPDYYIQANVTKV
jgi:hypothetical protein